MFDDEEKLNDLRDLPIYKKAEEILQVVTKICELIPEKEGPLLGVKENLSNDALTLCVKIAGAEGVDLYDIKMENAALIRKAARELMIQNHALEMFGFEEVAYYQIIRDLIEEFRLLFIDWVASFDPYLYMIDRWGLFNPPGVGPFDKDPDDDIPFNPDDEF